MTTTQGARDAQNELQEALSRVQGYDAGDLARKRHEMKTLIVQKWDEAAQNDLLSEEDHAYRQEGYEAIANGSVPRYVNEPIEAGTINWGKVQGALGIRGPM